MPEMFRSSSLLKRVLALIVLLVVAYLVIRVITGFLFGMFFLGVIGTVIAGVVWAYLTLTRR